MRYLIWSREHYAYWKASKFGYTQSIAEAGRFSLREAEQICIEANKHHREGIAPEESMVPDNE